MTLPPASSIRYGGDYNPEQWPTETWDDDYAAFNAAHMNTLTVGVFMWSLIQPDETTYDFDVLDAIIDRAHAEDRQVVLATATAAVPPWLATTYPDVNRVDFEGRHHNYGQRHNACHSSPNYRRLATELAGRIAQRYAHHPAVIAWHINNEYGGYGEPATATTAPKSSAPGSPADTAHSTPSTMPGTRRFGPTGTRTGTRSCPPRSSVNTGNPPTTPPSKGSHSTTTGSPPTP